MEGDFPGGTVVKNLPASAEDANDLGFNLWVRKTPKVGNGNPLQYFCLENSMDRGAWSLVGYSLWGCKELDSTEHACRVK